VTDKGILSRLHQQGITKMFPVQEETFRLIEAGRDVLASDRTGSGKTLGYTLPVL
jgi:ATP-dependent RNA helicase DDX21